MTVSMLKDIRPRSWHSVVCTRVSRMWDYRGGTDDGEIRHVDLVLIDAEGTAMYAEIRSEDVEAKRPLLTEGRVYTLKRFCVFKAKASYRPVESEFMMQITYHTLIEEKHDYPSDFPLYTYTLTNFDDLAALVGEIKRFIDVIGVITHVSDLSTVQLANQPRPAVRRMITLRDASNYEMKLSLWGQRAREFDIDEVRAMSQDGPVIAIFVGLLMKSYKGEDSLSGNTACRWYINADVPEIHEFFYTLGGGFQPIEHVVPEELEPVAPVINAEAEHKTLEDLLAISPFDFPPQGFRCTVTISRIDPSISWCYPACNRCSKTVHPHGTGYKCSHCNCTGYKFKYKICAMATDGSDEAEFIFFGEMGQRLVRAEVMTLMRSCRTSGDIPRQIASLVSQKYMLTINVTSKCLSKRFRSYQVNNINLAYGRQASIPVVRKSPAMPVGSKRKALVLHGESASGAGSKEDRHIDVLPSGQNLDDTPPPKETPGASFSKEKDFASAAGAHGGEGKRVHRRLFTSSSLDLEDRPKSDDAFGDALEDSPSANVYRSGTVVHSDEDTEDDPNQGNAT
uniref:Replication factor A C-terminal domain-containing protein n=1 Tax=Arundo donax TaxID=35708 RepID=A0A0A9CME8_ARUDO